MRLLIPLLLLATISFGNTTNKVYPADVYVIASRTSGTTTYGAGIDWKPTSWTGLGLEYRRFAPTIDARTIEGHALAARYYIRPIRIRDISLRFDAGIGVASDRDFTINPVPLLGFRSSLGYHLTKDSAIYLYSGYYWSGRVSLPEDRYFEPSWNPDIGIVLIIRLDDELLNLLRRYRP